MYTYHAPALVNIQLDTAKKIGAYAFAYCRQLKQVGLNDTLTEIPEYAFAGCISLETIDLSKVQTIGQYAFMEGERLAAVDLSAAQSIGEYAFVNSKELTLVKLNPNGVDLNEAVFAYCGQLSTVENLHACICIGDYAFAYTALTQVDLTGAVSIGNHAFIKETLTPFRVTLGQKLEQLGDNPFAMCAVEPFSQTVVTTFNGVDYTQKLYTYDISESVFVVDGSLYCKIPAGLELITYAGVDHTDVKVADGTVRITAMAFAGSDVEMVTLPYTVASIGHKAFYQCGSLKTVVFNSYHAPILEEEFDPTYYESFAHIPGTGDFGTYTDYSGNEVPINGMGLLPYFMWNATGSMYSNVFYGANFVDYVGYVADKLVMIRPVNGQNYDSFIFNQYFNLVINGSSAADDTTLAAIAAINALPDRVTYADKALVEAARAAYAKIATTEQQALVTNYAALISAEQRITALAPVEQPNEQDTTSIINSNGWVAFVVILLGVGVLAATLYVEYKREHPVKKAAEDKDQQTEE